MGKQPTCKDEGPLVYHFHVECSYLPRGIYTNQGGLSFKSSNAPFKAANDRAQGHAP